MKYKHVGPRETDFEPEGFDHEDDISLSDAVRLIKQLHPTATLLTIRKFLIGLPLHNAICGYAGSYSESFVREDRPHVGTYNGGTDRFVPIPEDFWRIEMAIKADAKQCFGASCLGNEIDISETELPYRMRSQTYGELANERITLYQSASDIHFPKADLISMAQDPEWQAWGSTAKALSDPRKRGKPPAWKWDEAKVALTIAAMQDPAVLQSLGSIVQFINDEMRHMHNEQLPNQKEVYQYARRFSGLWREPDPNDFPP